MVRIRGVFVSLNVSSYPPPTPKPTGGDLVPHERPSQGATTVDDQHLPSRDVEKQMSTHLK